MIKAPCKDCKERTVEPNCHMTCQRYLESVKEHKKRVESLKKLKQNYGRPNKFHFQGFHNWE